MKRCNKENELHIYYGIRVFLFEMCFWCWRARVFLMSPRVCSSFVEKKKVIRLPSVKTCLLWPWGEPACNWSVWCLTACPIGRRWPAVTSWLADGFNVRPRKHDLLLRLPDPVSRLTSLWELPVRGHGGESWLAPAVSQCRELRLPLGEGAEPLRALTSPYKPPAVHNLNTHAEQPLRRVVSYTTYHTHFSNGDKCWK